ncbi:uncharacterized protein LOC110962219 isoform X2 [Acanthochromis polyacanthus]|uniref:Uncharacterized LOC110962219 n=1 Tax=Acanthochromis polyacanthus TaxID=80966 RepID=A0A3Q1ERF4_9TELE|nr:uncharacterized protein LOC110962219 isoform X2 [Acanthochromis polyacanthus]
MGGRNCCVKNCRRRSHDHHGRKLPNGLTFHCFPAWRTNEGGQISELTRRRRAAWVAAVGRSDITFDSIPSSMRVCSRHFYSGRPAYEMLESDPDWCPSLNLGHNDGNLRRAERVLPSVQAKKKQKLKITLKKRPAVAFTAPQTQSEATEDEFPSLRLDQHDENSGPASCLLLSMKSKKKPKKRKKTETRPTEMSTSPQTQSEAAEDWVPSLQLYYDEGNLLSVKSKKKQIKRKKMETRPTEMSTTPQTQSEAAEDWVPSLHLEYNEGNSLSMKSKEKQIKREEMETLTTLQTQSEAAEGFKKPSVPPWRDVKSVLQSLIQINTNISKKPEDETLDRPAADNTELSFRDFFRNTLEASLEASIRSRAQSKASSCNSELTVELNLQVPPLRGKSDASSSSLPVSSSSSSSCLNCDRLQRRVEELKDKLSQFAGEQEDMKASAAGIEPEQSAETIYEIEEEVLEWSEPLSPDQVIHCDQSKASPSCRPRPRFRKEWLSMFWFLRYSPRFDHMWCHVCRLHASSLYHKMALIKGSRVFKMDTIKKHSSTKYHKENLEQYVRSGNRMSYQILL